MKNYRLKYLRKAIIKTMLSGTMYLFLPLLANIYDRYVAGYEGYTILGIAILVIGNIILLVWAWLVVLDPDIRRSHIETMENNNAETTD